MSERNFMEIKIIKVPFGEAPVDVREQWVGLVLPTIGFLPPSHEEMGVASGEVTGRRDVFRVPKEEALRILEQKDSTAAEWFRDNALPAENLTFGAGEVEIVS